MVLCLWCDVWCCVYGVGTSEDRGAVSMVRWFRGAVSMVRWSWCCVYGVGTSDGPGAVSMV